MVITGWWYVLVFISAPSASSRVHECGWWSADLADAGDFMLLHEPSLCLSCSICSYQVSDWLAAAFLIKFCFTPGDYGREHTWLDVREMSACQREQYGCKRASHWKTWRMVPSRKHCSTFSGPFSLCSHRQAWKLCMIIKFLKGGPGPCVFKYLCSSKKSWALHFAGSVFSWTFHSLFTEPSSCLKCVCCLAIMALLNRKLLNLNGTPQNLWEQYNGM